MKNHYSQIIFILLFLLTLCHAETPTNISLESNVTTLNVGEKAELTVMETYSDNTTKELNTNIEWIITPENSVDVNGSILTAKKDTNVTVHAKVDTVLSNILNLNIAWTVNGHVLPPEPDKALNDSTLLGIDTNNNGVRDDVERYIYETYEHPIERALLMQEMKYEQIILEKNTEIIARDKNTLDELNNLEDAYLACESYWLYDAEGNNETFILSAYSGLKGYQHRYFGEHAKGIQRNTIMRKEARDELEKAVSGGVYSIPKSDKNKCYFNATVLMKDYK